MRYVILIAGLLVAGASLWWLEAEPNIFRSLYGVDMWVLSGLGALSGAFMALGALAKIIESREET